MNAKEKVEKNGLRRWHVAFAVISLAAALLFFVSYWKDYDREWRFYQRQYASELRSFLSGQGEKDLPPTKFIYIQTVVEVPTRVDRCQMCHRAVDDPRFSKSPQPLTTHPKIPPHPFEKFGCTVCHGGQGRATTVADAHGNVPFWEEPLLKKPFTQAACGSCHRGVALKDAPLVGRGRQLYLQSGCIGCHRVYGVGGTVGPDLTWVGDRRKDPKWHEAHFRDPKKVSPGTTMPPYGHLPKKDIQALIVYLLSLRQAPSRLIAAPNVVTAAGKP